MSFYVFVFINGVLFPVVYFTTKIRTPNIDRFMPQNFNLKNIGFKNRRFEPAPG